MPLVHNAAWTVTVLALLKDNKNERIQYVLCKLHLTNQHLVFCARNKYFLRFALVVVMIYCREPSISSLFPGINIHEALCIDYLWLNLGVEKPVYEVDPCEHISRLVWDL